MNSGEGSFGELARFKAQVLNDFVKTRDVESVIELGCGDGHQLELAAYPSYLGLDVARTAIDRCLARFRDDATKSFLWYDSERSVRLEQFLHADLALSLDVLYHIMEESHFDAYLTRLFGIARRFVVIYSTNEDRGRSGLHVLHRRFSDRVAARFPSFRLIDTIPNPYPELSRADMFIYERQAPS
ncbi:MAG: class I SAM-dependent methyltransferase [Polyangiales bacterium]